MVDPNSLKSRLTASDYRKVFRRCGFDINGERGTELSGILGPQELGEGETGNFSVDLDKGLVKDWGSSEYRGDVIDVVQDVQSLSFPEALEWIVDELNLNASTLEREVANGSSSGALTPEPDTSDSESATEPVVSHEQVERWHERLIDEAGAAQVARRYLTGERGLHPGVLKIGRVGLAHEKEIPDDWGGFYRREARPVTWWIIFPVARRDLDGAPVVSVKGVGFDPENCDWKRNEDGEKIPSNVSSALWDLVPTEGNATKGNATARIDGPVLVCEGELDALCALSNGFNAVTGTTGAGTFKPEWARYLTCVETAQDHGVVVVYDGDETGRKGAQKAASKLHEAGLDVRVASLPDGKDVNDVLTEGGEEDLHAHLAQADPYGSSETDKAAETGESKEDKDNPEFQYEPFPASALPDPIQDYVCASARALGESVPPAMVAVPTLSVLSGAIGDAVRLRLKRTWTEPATLWTTLVAPSGSTKSPAFSHAVRPVFRRELKAKDEYERAIAEWKAQADPDPQDKPTRERYRTGDATPEAVVRILGENPRGVLLARDELGAWIGSFDRYVNGAADLQFWVEVWQGFQASRDRVGEGNTTIDTPVVPVTGTIQPGTLKEKLGEIHFDTGFAARLILCQPPTPPKRWTDADVTEEAKDRYAKTLGRLYDMPRDRVSSLTPEAKERWISYYNMANASLEERPEGPTRAVAAKGITHVARLALVLHRCRVESRAEPGDPYEIGPVDAQSMEAAIEVGRWLTRETLRVYERLGLATEAKSPVQLFLKQLPDQFKTKDAKEIAEENEIPRRTMFDWLDRLQESGTLERIRRGVYRKT
jgi:hypothetical protein